MSYFYSVLWELLHHTASKRLFNIEDIYVYIYIYICLPSAAPCSISEETRG